MHGHKELCDDIRNMPPSMSHRFTTWSHVWYISDPGLILRASVHLCRRHDLEVEIYVEL